MPRTKKEPVSQIPIWEAFDSEELKEVWDPRTKTIRVVPNLYKLREQPVGQNINIILMGYNGKYGKSRPFFL